MATYSSILAWKMTCTKEPGRLQSMGSQRVRHNLACTQCIIYNFYCCVKQRRCWVGMPATCSRNVEAEGSQFWLAYPGWPGAKSRSSVLQEEEGSCEEKDIQARGQLGWLTCFSVGETLNRGQWCPVPGVWVWEDQTKGDSVKTAETVCLRAQFP